MDISKPFAGAKLDAALNKPLYQQITEFIADKISNSLLPPGAKLPPERELAELFNVSRTTAINAYRQLEQQGLVRTKVGSGTYVTEQSEDMVDISLAIPWQQIFATYPQTHPSSVLRDLVATPAPDTVNLALGMPDPAFYPIDTFTELAGRYIKQLDRADLGYIPAEGYGPLRQAVARLLSEKSIPATTDNIIIVSGAQQGLYLLSRVLLEPGDYVVMESPTFIGAIQAFQAAGARVLNLPVADNLPLPLLEDYLIRYRPKILYLMPTYQNPTGGLISLEDRKNLLQLAARHRSVIVEDDPYSDLYYGEQPPPALKALDPYGGVVYVGTFSKNLVPGLRMGYIAASQTLVNRLAREKQFMDLHSNNIAQWMVRMFLADGLLADHLTLVRREYKKRRDSAAKALQRLCGNYIDFSLPAGGFYFWCKMKNSGSTRRLLHEAAKNGVSFMPGEAFYTVSAQDKELRLCFTMHNEKVLTEGIQRLAKTLARAAAGKKNEESALYPPARPIV